MKIQRARARPLALYAQLGLLRFADTLDQARTDGIQWFVRRGQASIIVMMSVGMILRRGAQRLSGQKRTLNSIYLNGTSWVLAEWNVPFWM